jgi:hypothetical protein
MDVNNGLFCHGTSKAEIRQVGSTIQAIFFGTSTKLFRHLYLYEVTCIIILPMFNVQCRPDVQILTDCHTFYR